MSSQIKVLNQLIKDLIAVTEESLDRKPASKEVEVYWEIISCVINIMKPKLDRPDIAQVAFEWHINATQQSWNNLNPELKNADKHYFKRKKTGSRYLGYSSDR